MFYRFMTSACVGLALGVGAAAAQDEDRLKTFVIDYPILAELEDEECLPRLAELEQGEQKDRFKELIDGELFAADFEEADKDLLKCLELVEKEVEIAAAEDAASDKGKGKEKKAKGRGKGRDKEREARGKPEDTPGGRSSEAKTEQAQELKPADVEEKSSENEPKESAAPLKADASSQTEEQPTAKAEKKGLIEKFSEGRGQRKKQANESAGDERAPEAKTADEVTLKEALAKSAAAEEKEVDQSSKAEEKVAEDQPSTADEKPLTGEQAAKATETGAPEAVQKDTKAAEEAANETVNVAAKDEQKAEEVEVVEVTEETARSSSEDFKPRARSADNSDDTAAKIGAAAAAAGVIGGAVLNEILSSNEEVAANTGDRLVIKRGAGDYYVLKDEGALLRRPGARVETERFNDGSVRETVTRKNGVRVVTIRAANGRVVRRERILPDGRSVLLFDDTEQFEPIDLDKLPRADVERVEVQEGVDAETLRRLLAEAEADRVEERRYSLRQIREIRAVRNLVPTLELENITFETGSAAIRPSEAQELAKIGFAMREMIEANPYEVFLIEGHTDAVGSAASNLALSDRRAESVALALAEYFDVPPESMVVQGYGESNLRVQTQGSERLNRRAAVRRITPLLRTARRD